METGGHPVTPLLFVGEPMVSAVLAEDPTEAVALIQDKKRCFVRTPGEAVVTLQMLGATLEQALFAVYYLDKSL